MLNGRGLGFKALQIPLSDPRLKDLAGLAEPEAVAKIEAVMSKAGLKVSEIAAQRSGQLLAVHPAYDETMNAERAHIFDAASGKSVLNAVNSSR